LFCGGAGNQLTANLLFCAFVLVWTGTWSLLVFSLLKVYGVLRVSTDVEDEGMDSSEHGVKKAPFAPQADDAILKTFSAAPQGPSFSSTNALAATGASAQKGKAKAPSSSSTDALPDRKKKRGKPVKAPPFSSANSLPQKGASKAPEKAKVGAKLPTAKRLGSPV
jgi:hypothetical protein